MAMKMMNFKMDEADAADMKMVANVYNISVTDLIRAALKEYLDELKQDPFYRLTANVEDASPEESDEILTAVSGLSDDDLSISSVNRFAI